MCRVRFSDNTLIINQPLQHQMQLSHGEHIAIAFADQGNRTPSLLLFKTDSSNPNAIRIKSGGTSNLKSSVPAVVSLLLQTYQLAPSQGKGIAFTLQADHTTIQQDGTIFFNLGRPELLKGGPKA
ncbi:MAG: hypothetical protein ACK52I_14840 [Pseudomonadota bacterium]